MERPKSVPEGAAWIAKDSEWELGAIAPSGKKHGSYTYWHADGTLSKEGVFVEGLLDGRWRYSTPDGKLVEDTTYALGLKYGPSKVFNAASAAAYAVPGAAGLRGDYERGVRVGVWHLLGVDGKRLLSRDFGAAVSDDELADSPALANQRRSGSEWLGVAESFARERRFGEAVVARARAAARSASTNGFLAAFAELSLPTTPGGADVIAEEVLRQSGDLAGLFSGFLRGGSPALLCHALAVWADSMNFGLTALDLVNAALLVAPQRHGFVATRAKVLMRLGLPGQVDLDLQELAATEPEQALMLEAENRALFRACDFWPAAAALDGVPNDAAVAPAQSLAAVQSVIAKYARRLTCMREAVLEHVRPEVPWLVPDLTDLLRGEELVSATAIVGDREIEIDEAVDLTALELLDLQRRVHNDWSALTWLCWSVGLAAVEMPATVAAPADFGKTYGVLTQRADDHENVETAAMMRWLVDASARSPWQEDLRGS